jgi:hypothetical protein
VHKFAAMRLHGAEAAVNVQRTARPDVAIARRRSPRKDYGDAIFVVDFGGLPMLARLRGAADGRSG